MQLTNEVSRVLKGLWTTALSYGIVCVTVFVVTAPAAAQTDCDLREEVIQAGIFTIDASNVMIRMRPSANLSGCNVASASIVIRWPEDTGNPLSVSSLTNGGGMPTGLPWGELNTATSGGFDYSWLATIPASPPAGAFAQNTEYDMVQVTFNRAGTEQIELVATTLAQSIFGGAAGWAFQYTTMNKANNTSEFYQTSTTLPVELTDFSATADGNHVVLTWTTATETDNAGFEVQYAARSVSEVENDYEEDPSQTIWTPLDFIVGKGTTTEEQVYSFRVTGIEVGTYRFRLRQVDLDGASSYSEEIEATIEVLGDYEVSDVYPNPFNPRARITLAVRESQEVDIAVYDVIGRRVQTLFTGDIPAHTTRHIGVDGSRLASGLYVVRAAGEKFAVVKTMLLVK